MSEQNRRKLLKSIALGSGTLATAKLLPQGWQKPIVDTVVLPAHAEASPPEPCTPCLDAATYCEGQGQGSPQISVAADGTVTATLRVGVGMDTVDPCTGGSYEIIISAPQGPGTISVTGTIPCGVTDSIQATFDDGQQEPFVGTLTKDNCLD